MQFYNDYKVFVRVSDGLLQPITTTIGVKQGCCLSSLLFNLFVKKLPSVFGPSCDPVSILNEDISCLLWADDLVILSKSPTILQNAMNKTKLFYELCDKASRACFAISNDIYKHKRLPVARALQLFDSLIRPIALFLCKFWLPMILPKKFLTQQFYF